MVALGIALVGSVRSRRRDLAVLKAIGFTRRQLSLMIETQAVVTVLAGAVIGIPLGVALGSTVWRRFADDLGVLAETRVPVARRSRWASPPGWGRRWPSPPCRAGPPPAPPRRSPSGPK